MGKTRPVPMNLLCFAVEAYVLGGGVQNQADKNFEKCLPAGTGTTIYFSSWMFLRSFLVSQGAKLQLSENKGESHSGLFALTPVELPGLCFLSVCLM